MLSHIRLQLNYYNSWFRNLTMVTKLLQLTFCALQLNSSYTRLQLLLLIVRFNNGGLILKPKSNVIPDLNFCYCVLKICGKS